MNIRAIWKSYDFRGNKILNAKVNTPVQDGEIAPKSYVDKTTKFDTVKSNQFPSGSPKFSWLNFSLKDKTFKELFDDLFFPVIAPVYTEVVFEKVKVTAINEYGTNLFLGRLTQFNIDYIINRGDRQSTVIPKIKVTTKEPITVTEHSGTSSSNTSNFNFTINLANIDKIELVKTFQKATTKNDNYGVPVIPLNFNVNYDATYDVLQNIKQNYDFKSPIIYRKLTPTENATTIVSLINDSDSLSTPVASILTTFVRDRKLFTTADSNNNFLFGIEKNIFKDSLMNVKITDSVDQVSNFDISQTMLTLFGEKIIKYFGEDGTYTFFTIDFGYHKTIKEVNISMNKFKQS
jgi:hypothetical protein